MSTTCAFGSITWARLMRALGELREQMESVLRLKLIHILFQIAVLL